MDSKSSESPKLERRSFLKVILGFSFVSTFASILIPIVGYLIPPEKGSSGGGGRVLAATMSDIPIGEGKVVPIGSKPVIITNTEQGVKAFSAICTHLGCVSTWDSNRKIILCPCHDGQFSPVTGAVLAGPPPTGLPEVEVFIDGEDIYIGEV